MRKRREPTNYERGRAFEYRTRNALLKNGAVYVMRAAQSKGIVDLLALWPATLTESITPRGDVPGATSIIIKARPWLVQCKYSIKGGGTISPADRQKLRDLAGLTGLVPVVATPGKNGRGVVFTTLEAAA